MHGKTPLMIIVALIVMLPHGVSAAPLIGSGGLAAATEKRAPVENVHYYGYGRGYYGRGYYGRGYYGRGYYGRGYYGRGYYGYGRGYYGGYGHGYGYRYY